MTSFRSRGHYCNYCRKIISSKSPNGFNHHPFNLLIWHVWDTSGDIEQLLTQMKALPFCEKEKEINKKVKALAKSYGVLFHVEH